MAVTNSLCVWISLCILVFGTISEARSTPDNVFDFISKQTAEIYNNIENSTKEFVGGIPNRAAEIYNNIENSTRDFVGNIPNRTTGLYNDIVNSTSDFVGNIPDRSAELYNDIVNSTSDFVGNIPDRSAEIYNNIENRTKDFVDNISNDVHTILESNDTKKVLQKIKDCSIVLGGAVAGAVIGPLAIGLGTPLVLCLLGFTCWGIMAGSCAACCQSSIGNVPAGSCFACLQGRGAGGVWPYLFYSLIVGVPIGLALGGYIAETYVHCFSAAEMPLF